MRKYLALLALLCYVPLIAQDCVGGAIRTDETYLYGRFETRMRSAAGSGVVSSFFMYNLDGNCNWPVENNEIDIEMTGISEDIYFTTHYPGPWFHSDSYDVSFNPHLQMHDYAFEWEPGIVRWFVDGNLVNVQAQSFVADLIHPMPIIMNLWAVDAPSWAGPWDPAILPVTSAYEYVKCYAYTPGAGNYGTSNNFTHLWTDDFNAYDSDRWTISEYGTWDGNYCNFHGSSVDFVGGKMELTLQPPFTNTEFVPVTITVDMSEANIGGSYFVNISGNFNNWCGSCAIMSHQGNGIYSLTVDLPPGRNEYVFSVNNWSTSSGPPLGSYCDFEPCDTYANYGLVVPTGSGPITVDPVCYGECLDCGMVALESKITLGACYNASTGLMNDDLRALGLIPTTEPYTTLSGFNHVGGGGESIAASVLNVSGNNAIVDWVFLELRDKSNSSNVLVTRSALLQRDGDIVDVDGVSKVTFPIAYDDYYVAVRHRNHLGVMTDAPVVFNTSTITSFDFSNPATGVWGSHAMRGLSGLKTMWPGNGNQNATVIYQGAGSDITPITSVVFTDPSNTTFQLTYPAQGYHVSDYNMDGQVIYQGSGSDILTLTQAVFTYPLNTSFQLTYPISEQLP